MQIIGFILIAAGCTAIATRVLGILIAALMDKPSDWLMPAIGAALLLAGLAIA